MNATTVRPIRKHKIRTEYLDKVYNLNKFKKMIDLAVKRIKKFEKCNSFEAIAFTGNSGAAIAYPLSLRLCKPLICVRKNDSSHYGVGVEGCMDAKSYIIVDDFIDSGKTILRIMSEIKKDYTRIPKLVGIYLYNDYNKSKFIWGINSKIEDLKILRIS